MTSRPWFPTIYLDKCDCCNGTYKCVNFCPHEVLEVREDEVSVVNPLGCIYGCSACADLCAKNAIATSDKLPIVTALITFIASLMLA